MATSEQKKRRIVIIGGGVMGLSAAVEAAQIPGARVTLLEADYPGSGSTSRSAGVYTRQYLARRDIELRARSVEVLFRLEREGRITMRRTSFIRLGRSAEDTSKFEHAVELQRELGVEDPGRVIDADELGALVPDYDRTGVVSALYGPTDGYLDGAVLCSSLSEEAQQLGVRISVRSRLRSARRTSSGAWELADDDDSFEADIVINCAGAWTEEVGDILGAPVRMVNERHEAFTLELPPQVEYDMPMVMDYVPDGTPTEGLYFRAEGENQMIAGVHSSDILGVAQADPNDYFEGATEAGTTQIVSAIARAFPDVEDIRLRGGWAGLYPHSATGRPLAGPHPDEPSVIVGSGLGGVGLSLGPAMGKLLREWIEFGEPRTIAGAIDMLPPRA
jgi:sarcosine oxidase subunit beta